MTHLRPVIAVAVTGALLVPASALAARRVAVKDDFFARKSLTIKKGTKVRWRWRGDGLHNVTVARGPVKFRSSTKDSGSYSHVFRRKGTYKILCTVHAPDMRMTIRVR
jgi:plastocyanin